MNVLLIPVGSRGDVYPFAALGRKLQARGHRVTLIAGGGFASIAREQGFDFVPLCTPEQQASWAREFSVWNSRVDWRQYVDAFLVELMQPAYEAVASRYVPGETVVLAHPQAIGARLAQEHLGIPLVTLCVTPFYFQSSYQNRRLPQGNLPDWLPRPLRRTLLATGDRLVDLVFGRRINRFRSELGLPPARRLFSRWWFSPSLVLGLFPDWFAPPQPDWPSQVRLLDFPFYEGPAAAGLSAEVEAYLSSGPAPVVFTSGSWMSVGRSFFEASAEACRRLGCRGILLTGDVSEVPEDLPAGVVHFDFVPFGSLLPRASAIVHPGGIGTIARGLASGIPQLTVPLLFDHADNVHRLRRLGVSRVLLPGRYRAERVARELETLLGDASVRAACAEVREQHFPPQSIAVGCDAIERLAAGPTAVPPETTGLS